MSEWKIKMTYWEANCTSPCKNHRKRRWEEANDLVARSWLSPFRIRSNKSPCSRHILIQRIQNKNNWWGRRSLRRRIDFQICIWRPGTNLKRNRHFSRLKRVRSKSGFPARSRGRKTKKKKQKKRTKRRTHRNRPCKRRLLVAESCTSSASVRIRTDKFYRRFRISESPGIPAIRLGLNEKKKSNSN